MKTKKQKKGVSLIVLVITIIVMIILATAIIISLTNNGIIDSAKNAVDKTNEKQVEELASLAWADAYAENVGKSDEELLSILKNAVKDALDKNNIKKEEYIIDVTTKGVTVTKKENSAEGLVQKEDRTVVKGNTVLNIGDYVNYVSGVEGYTDENGWQVLGAENGELLILSSSNVTTKSFNSEKTLEGGKAAYENGISELNEICAPYGEGAYATGARSITVEDIDRVTGYDKTTYGKGTIFEYGNIVTYKYNGTNKPAYSGSNGVSGTLSSEHSNGFHWYDENGVYHNVSGSNLTSNTTGVITADGVEAKIRSEYYNYIVSRDTNLKTESPNAYSMLCGSSSSTHYQYMCASSYTGNPGGVVSLVFIGCGATTFTV